MRYNDKINSFTDLNEYSFLRQPHIVVRKDDIDYREIITEADLYLSGKNRVCIYETAAGVKHYLEFTPYVHPAGAAALTIGTLATSATGVVTYTPTAEGRLINESGVLVPADEEASDVAGMLLTDYFYHFTDNASQHETHRVITINEGDFLWLVRRGKVELDVSGSVSANDILMSSATVAGECQLATVIDVTSTTTLRDTLKKNLLGDANPRFFGLAKAIAARVGAGLVSADLLLPPRHYR